MSEIILFKGKDELSAQESLFEFIKQAKINFPFVGVNWDEDIWDITGYAPTKTQGRHSERVLFRSFRDIGRNNGVVQIPWITLLKNLPRLPLVK